MNYFSNNIYYVLPIIWLDMGIDYALPPGLWIGMNEQTWTCRQRCRRPSGAAPSLTPSARCPASCTACSAPARQGSASRSLADCPAVSVRAFGRRAVLCSPVVVSWRDWMSMCMCFWVTLCVCVLIVLYFVFKECECILGRVCVSCIVVACV